MSHDTTKNDGGAAYPHPMADNKFWKGMSLRDWFAGMALLSSGREIRKYEHENNYKLIAEGAYGIADAMLKERENVSREKNDAKQER